MFGAHVNRYHADRRPADGVRRPSADAPSRPSIVAEIEAARAEAFAEAGLDLTAAAIFVGGPKNRAITLRPAERSALRRYVAHTGVRVIAHSSYSAAPWRGDPGAARFIREELSVCQEAGIAGLVVHLPKLPPGDVLRYLPDLRAEDAPDVRVYLETPAVRPGESYYETPEKLADLFAAIRAGPDPGLRHFGLCVDTAHLWTCGVDLQSYEAAAAWFDGLEAAASVIPPSAVAIHFNDSLRPRGVGPDAHAGLAQGKIWGGLRDRLGESGVAAVVDYAQRHGTPVILERKPKEALRGDYLTLRKLIAGRDDRP